MPLYEFLCSKCGFVTEDIYRNIEIAENEPPYCCDLPMEILMSVPADPVIKGSRRLD